MDHDCDAENVEYDFFFDCHDHVEDSNEEADDYYLDDYYRNRIKKNKRGRGQKWGCSKKKSGRFFGKCYEKRFVGEFDLGSEIEKRQQGIAPQEDYYVVIFDREEEIASNYEDSKISEFKYSSMVFEKNPNKLHSLFDEIRDFLSSSQRKAETNKQLESLLSSIALKLHNYKVLRRA